MQSVRNLAMSLPIHYHVDDDDESRNGRCVLHCKDDTRINKDVDRAEVNA